MESLTYFYIECEKKNYFFHNYDKSLKKCFYNGELHIFFYIETDDLLWLTIS